MDKDQVGERFRNLAMGSENRPETARLRDIFDEVEVALTARVPQVEVLAELHKLGFKMNIGAFKSALQRIRKERASKVEPESRPTKGLGTKATSTAPVVTLASKQNEPISPQPKSKNLLHALAGKPDDLSHIPAAPFEVDKSN